MADPVWEEFRRTCVRVSVPGGALDVAPTTDGNPGAYVPDTEGPIHMITAQNPMGLPTTNESNTAANARLAAELETLDGILVSPVVGYGGGPLDGDGTWQEDGFAIVGLSRADAITLADRYRQRAIFEWRNEPGGFRLVACDGSADEARGWAATLLPDG